MIATMSTADTGGSMTTPAPEQTPETPAKPLEEIFPGFTPVELPSPRVRKHRWLVVSVRAVLAIAGSLAAFGLLVVRPMLDGHIAGWAPSAGDCVTAAHSSAEVKNVRRVDCSDGDAAFKVLKVFKYRDKAEFEGPQNPCLDDGVSVETIFYGKPHNGFILCLADN
jgi:hypothetical protein